MHCASIRCFFPLLGLLLFAGCEANRYEIELTPQENTIKRDLTTWRESGEKNPRAFPVEELKKIARAYDVPVPDNQDEKHGKHKFAGLFAGDMPDDVGGRGSYLHWETSLGSLSAYVERFRGQDDLLADVESRLKASDRLANLLMGWLESELENEAGFPALKEFLDARLRRDLKNLSLYRWAEGVAAHYQNSVGEEFLLRASQYLYERSYFSREELPELMRALQELEQEDPARLLQFLQRFLASKMGVPVDQPVPKSLAFLTNEEVLKESFNDSLRQTDEFRQLQNDWEQEKTRNPCAKAPEPGHVVGNLVGRAFAFTLDPADELLVKLAVPIEPVMTNGEWNPQAQQVHWSRHILAADSDLFEFPTLLYAMWTQPDADAQKKHFGRVVLEGEPLARYVLWQRGLSEKEAKEWADFLTSLKPGDEMKDRLQSFRFSHEPPVPAEKAPTGLSAIPIELVLHGLDDEAKPDD